MNITIAKNAGFCFGVKRAADTVKDLIETSSADTKIYTLGKLIHNDIYNAELESRGVRAISLDDVEKIKNDTDEKSPSVIVIRTHGVAREVEEVLRTAEKENPYLKIIDCTCPFVKKIHNIARDNTDENTLFILLGDKAHPEVEGIASYVKGQIKICGNAAELETLADEIDPEKRVVLAAQTTQKLSEWEKCQKIIQNLCTNRLIFDTICSVTENRQTEVEKLAREMDAMIVIGGRNSSNTAKLFSICRKNCARSVWIEAAKELTKDPFGAQVNNVGIAAGASTPDGIIQEVYKTMKEQVNNENFAELLESSLKTLNTGDTVKGIVTAISPNEVQLDLGAKVTGVITAEQLTEDPSVKLGDIVKIGDEIEAFVIRVSDVDGVAMLSKRRTDSDKNWNNIVAAKESGEILEGKVIEAVKGGVIILIDSVRVFIPASQTGVPRDGDLSVLVGTTQRVRIMDIKLQNHRAYASIRSVLAEERKAREEAVWSTIAVGNKYTGKVKSITNYGAFVDLGGVDGMVHTSELSWKRIKNPSEVVNVGDEITVTVKELDPEKKRISLTYKSEENDPWYIFTQKYNVGDTASVKIVSLMPFGAFAEIVDGVDGLIHISQIARKRIANPAEVLKVGEVVDVKIVDVDNERRKVNLSITALLEPEAPAEENAAEETPAEEAPASDTPAEE